MAEEYWTTPWRGRTALSCAACAWKTTDEAAMQKHVRSAHRRAPRYRGQEAPAPAPAPVTFASPAAEQAAARMEVTPEALRAAVPAPTGARGAYTLADVKAAARHITETP